MMRAMEIREAKAEAAELIADEMVWMIEVIGWAESEAVKSWCHLWAEQFRKGSEDAPDIKRIERVT
jgi:hypothetical protein